MVPLSTDVASPTESGQTAAALSYKDAHQLCLSNLSSCIQASAKTTKVMGRLPRDGPRPYCRAVKSEVEKSKVLPVVKGVVGGRH